MRGRGGQVVYDSGTRNNRGKEEHVKVLLAIARCRTAALGGHLDECTRCGYRATISFNSCRNRHYPKCQIAKRSKQLRTWKMIRQLRRLGYRIEAPNPQPSQAQAQ